MTEWKQTDWSAAVYDPTDACDVEMIHGLWHSSNATVVPIVYVTAHHFTHLAMDEGIPVPFSYVPSYWFLRKFDCHLFSVSYSFLVHLWTPIHSRHDCVDVTPTQDSARRDIAIV